MNISMTQELPYNVLHRLVSLADRNDQVKLSQLNKELSFVVCSKLYHTIMVVDDDYTVSQPEDLPFTLLRVSDLSRFANCLSIRNFHYINKVIINTHNSDVSSSLIPLYHKLSQLWSVTEHVISFINYDILTLRVTDSLNNFMESNSIQFAEYDDGDIILAKKSRKIQNLRNWFMFNIQDFLVAPFSRDLQRLSLYLESNQYQGNADEGYTIEKPNYDNVRRNLSHLSELFLHSALAFVKFSELVQELGIPKLQLKRLSLTSTHRLRNNAVLDFHQILNMFDLNHIEELELKISCARQHECQDSCMVNFFSDWKMYNAHNGLEASVRKLCLVHHKSLTESVQFKNIVENFIFDSHFSNLREIYLNLSNTVRSPGPHLSVDVNKVIDRLTLVPDLEVLHVSSFMSEWLWIPPRQSDDMLSYHDILVNRCTCRECKATRNSFNELAALDRAKNYSHKLAFAEARGDSAISDTSVDFTLVENVKFLQYVCGLLKMQESIMERNLVSSGTMMDMEYMPEARNCELESFKNLLQHSFLDELHEQMTSRLRYLKKVNFGGISICT